MARGSIFRRHGGYAIRVDLGPDPATGKRRQHYKQGFRTKREAEAALDELLATVRSGDLVSQTATTLGQFLDDWLAGQNQRLKETTWNSYSVAVERIRNGLGKRKLQALAPLEIERFYLQLAESGGRTGRPLAAKTIRNTHVVLRKALDDAERLGLVQRNAAAVARPPVAHRTEQQTWSADNLRAFFAHAADDRLYAAYVLLATTGMRRGEALGLRWSDLDLEHGQLAVVNTLTTVNYRPILSTPKTKRSRRVIYLDPATVDVMRRHRALQQTERAAAGPARYHEIDFVFRDELGRPIHPEWFTREFGRQARAAQLPTIRLHDLRHTFATLALKEGVHPKVVSERLGHATVGITLDLYSHVTPAIAREAADTVGSLILGPRPAGA